MYKEGRHITQQSSETESSHQHMSIHYYSVNGQKRLVILIHGFSSDPDINTDLGKKIPENTCATNNSLY